MDLHVCGAVLPGMEFGLRFTIARRLHEEALTPLITLRHFALIVTEDSVMTWSNQTLETICRPASPLGAGWQFERAVHAPACVSGGSRSALRWATSHHASRV
jgi:hypothetical protein